MASLKLLTVCVLALAALVSAASCSNACSGNGVCSAEGVCACKLSYLGPDCSLKGLYTNLTADDTFYLSYGLLKNTLYLGLQWVPYDSSLTLGYAAIGWGATDPTKGMVNVSMLAVNATAKNASVAQCIEYQSTGHKMPTQDTIQDCVVLAGELATTAGYVQVTRPLRAGDDRDQKVYAGAVIVSYALGETMDFEYHYGPHGTLEIDFSAAPLTPPSTPDAPTRFPTRIPSLPLHTPVPDPSAAPASATVSLLSLVMVAVAALGVRLRL